MKIRIPYAPILLAPWVFYAIGVVLNALVMTINHNQMPVFYPGGDCPKPDGDIIHSCMVAGTHLKFLADWIIAGNAAESIGDLFLTAYQNTAVILPYVWVALVVKDYNSGGKDSF